MLGDGIVSFGVPCVDGVAQEREGSAKIVCGSVTRGRRRAADGGAQSYSPLGVLEVDVDRVVLDLA